VLGQFVIFKLILTMNAMQLASTILLIIINAATQTVKIVAGKLIISARNATMGIF